MCEMLANQYYLTQRFQDAIVLYEKVLLVEPSNNIAKKKLMVCYIRDEQVEKALKLFAELISKGNYLSVESKHDETDFIYKQMIYELENFPSSFTNIEKLSVLGILWFFYDIHKSQKYFEKIIRIEPSNFFYNKICRTINQSFFKIYKEKENGTKKLFT